MRFGVFCERVVSKTFLMGMLYFNLLSAFLCHDLVLFACVRTPLFHQTNILQLSCEASSDLLSCDTTVTYGIYSAAHFKHIVCFSSNSSKGVLGKVGIGGPRSNRSM